MIEYIFRSGLSLLLIYGIYRLVFQREKMLSFNRYYLLGGLIFSALVPFIPIEYTFNLFPENESIFSQPIEAGSKVIVAPSNYTSDFSNLGYILKILYGLITALLLFRFSVRIYALLAKARQHPQVKYAGATLVLLKEKTLPYSFFKYIYLEEKLYHQGNIPEELFTHELAHAKQRHSLDILLLEALTIFFWINPLFKFYKKAIQVNHEYLADDAVIKRHQQPRAYQYLLINKSATNSALALTSTFNYSVTKNRLKMMYKKTSPTRRNLFAALCLPLFTALLLLCGKSVQAQTNATDQAHQTMKDEYFKNATFVCKDDPDKIVYKAYADLSTEEKKNLPPPPPPPPAVDGSRKMLKALPKGSIVEYTKDGRVLIDSSGKNAPPAPPMPPRGKESLKAPKAPKAPKAVKPVKAPKAPKAAKAPKAPKTLKPVKAPKPPKPPKSEEGKSPTD